ncbi:MAG: precorrin-4 C(11)-methyltransferase [Atopobiaceae bacterium]|nr:precorrin-4 C(11)-methyltransferase [Atopobiaceae bacterium]
MIHFVGAGPGAPDLITLRGAELLQKADVVVYAGSLVNPDLLALTPDGCAIHDSSRMTLEEVLDILVEAAKRGQEVVRLHTGDPSLYGAIREQMDALDARGIAYTNTPGVSSFCGAAASIGAEYTLPGVSQTLVVTRLAGRTPVPETERLRDLAAHKASMAIFLSAGMLDGVQEELLCGGYAATTPVALVYKATWPDERVVRTNVGNLAHDGKAAGIRSTALILVGDFLQASYERSRLYDPSFSTGFRAAKACEEKPRQDELPEAGPCGADLRDKGHREAYCLSTSAPSVSSNREAARRSCRAQFRRNEDCLSTAPSGPRTGQATLLSGHPTTGLPEASARTVPSQGGIQLVSFSDEGERLAHRVAQALGGTAWRCTPGGLAGWTKRGFEEADALVFVGATGIAVRAIAPYVRTKACDPAVVVVDDRGRFTIPILSGHLGGANDLARRIARVCNAEAIITTATDGRGIFAVDEWARHQGCTIANPARIKQVSATLLAGGTIRVASDWPLPPDAPEGLEVGASGHADVLLSDRAHVASQTLHVVPRILTLGIGCRKDTPKEVLAQRVRDFVEAAGFSMCALEQICSINNKADERGILELAQELSIPYRTFSAAELAAVPGEFATSQFVQQMVGVDNVCERSAVLGSGYGTLVRPKDARDGITLALARRTFAPTWRWTHDE